MRRFVASVMMIAGTISGGLTIAGTASVVFASSTVSDTPSTVPALSGYLQLWTTFLEQVENGKQQPFTGDEAADVASGFSIRRARVQARFGSPTDRLRGRVELRLEGSPALSDAYGVWRCAGPALELWFGQMKIPSTYEIAIRNDDLDFVSRSEFSRRVVDWSLARSAAVSSPLNGVRAYLRDLGLALRGEARGLHYNFMVGNGLGANLFVGGEEQRQFIYTNSLGAYFIGARLSFHPLELASRRDRLGPLTDLAVGGHFNRNHHSDVLFGDTRTVLDIYRLSWSLDLQLALRGRLRLIGMAGEGFIKDDFDYDGRTDYAYRGWEVRGVMALIREHFFAGLRYDVYWDERSESGDDQELSTLTFGVTCIPAARVRLQLQYKHKSTDSATEPDLKDDLLLASTQIRF